MPKYCIGENTSDAANKDFFIQEAYNMHMRITSLVTRASSWRWETQV